jgi:hypothetical protein
MGTTARAVQSTWPSSPATVSRICCPKKRVLTSAYCLSPRDDRREKQAHEDVLSAEQPSLLRRARLRAW